MSHMKGKEVAGMMDAKEYMGDRKGRGKKRGHKRKGRRKGGR